MLCFVTVATIRAATFIVPDDLEFFKRADAVVVGSALTSYTRLTDNGSVQTVTPFSIEEVVKGSLDGQTVDVIEPGGVFESRATVIPGMPRFEDGKRYLLFLIQAADGWHVRDLALGKFSFATDADGRNILVRDEEEIAGWDPDGSVHLEPHRASPLFLAYLRKAALGQVPVRDYPVPKDPVVPPNRRLTALSSVAPLSASLVPAVTATFSATSYTFVLSGSLGGRWNVFPSPVTFFSVGTEPGAPNGGADAINAAFAAWNNDPSSNVNYVYGGQDVTGTHNGGVNGSDGKNTIAFEQDLAVNGVGPFQCSANGYSGTLGIGGITKALGTHTGPNGETFATALEGDVQMNKGIANCTLLFQNGDFNSAVTHEVGHTLGFRHSDQTRADNPSVACTTDPTLECADVAIMKSFIPNDLNATLQPWDQHAVAAVYPGSTVAAPSAPTGVNARATSTTSVLVTWNGVTGATSYEPTASSDIVVITAGIPRKPGMSRDDLLNTNAGLVKNVTESVVKFSPNCILIIVSNPLDAMCEVARRVSKFPRERVIGMAGVLDSARMRAFIAMELNVSVENTHAFVLGGHGDTMVPLPRYSTVAGIPITDLMTKEQIDKISARTARGGLEITELVGTSAWYAPGASVVEMIESILLDKKKILPCSVYLQGEYGTNNLFVGVPCKLGARGLEQIIQIKLTAEEDAAFKKSAGAVKELVDVIGV